VNLVRILWFYISSMVHVTVSYTRGDKGLLLNGCTSIASHFNENAENLVPHGPTIYDLQDRSIGDFSMRKSKNRNRRQGDGQLSRKSHSCRLAQPKSACYLTGYPNRREQEATERGLPEANPVRVFWNKFHIFCYCVCYLEAIRVHLLLGMSTTSLSRCSK
jgi:hypothetical protein